MSHDFHFLLTLCTVCLRTLGQYFFIPSRNPSEIPPRVFAWTRLFKVPRSMSRFPEFSRPPSQFGEMPGGRAVLLITVASLGGFSFSS